MRRDLNLMQTINRFGRGRGASRRNNSKPRIHHRRLLCETLEDRRLLSIITLYPTDDAYVLEANPDTNYGSSETLDLINGSSPSRARALLKFDLSCIPTESTVTSATLGMYAVRNDSDDTVYVHAAEENWREGGVKWKNQPSVSGPYASAAITTLGWKTFDVTSLVQEWVVGPRWNDGFFVRNLAADWTCFSSKEGDYSPYLKVVTGDTVYWAARDMAEVANHHFIAICFSGLAPASWNSEHIVTLASGNEAMIVGGYDSNGVSVPGGYLEHRYHWPSDVEATNDWFAGGDFHGSWDPELHAVTPPSGVDFDSFSTVVYELTQIYDNQVDYVLGVYPDVAQNCATFVNTVMAKAGIPEDDRDDLGEFWGVDWGEENILPSGHFDYVTDLYGSDDSVTRRTKVTLTATTMATDALEKVDFYWDSDGDGSLSP